MSKDVIAEFVAAFEAAKPVLREAFKASPGSYKDIVKAVVTVLDAGGYNDPDPDRIHEINDGDYQGTLLYVIGAKGYQPGTYWYVKVGYGSCSGCDTLEAIRGYTDEPATEEQINDYMTLALHIVQGLKLMGDDSV